MEILETIFGGHAATVSVPVASGIKEDVDIRREPEAGLGEKAESNLGAEEVASVVGCEERRTGDKGNERTVVENFGSGIGGAMEDFFAFDVRLEDIVEVGHEGNPRLEFGKFSPDLRLSFVDGVDSVGEDVVVVGHVNGNTGSDLFKIAYASGLLCRTFGPREDRKEDGGKDCNDRNDN